MSQFGRAGTDETKLLEPQSLRQMQNYLPQMKIRFTRMKYNNWLLIYLCPSDFYLWR
jgi:hypothetical protein